jgi:hypothetical protein
MPSAQRHRLTPGERSLTHTTHTSPFGGHYGLKKTKQYNLALLCLHVCRLYSRVFAVAVSKNEFRRIFAFFEKNVEMSNIKRRNQQQQANSSL